MEKFTKYEIAVGREDESAHYGKYVVGPLEKGFGLTLGNALRRVLLSAIPGAAAFAVRIAGASHEYQTVPGVLEDVTELVLNVKSLIFKIDDNVYSDDELDSLTLENWPVVKVSKTAGDVTGADLECPAGISVVNREFKLATVGDKGKLDMQIYVTRSRGFKSFHENRDRLNAAGIIATDSVFSPVVRVSYAVEETKTARRGTSDRLVLEVATNGTIAPGDAVATAARILSAHFEPLVGINDRLRELRVLREREAEDRQAALAIPLEDLALSVRSYNGLKRAGIATLAELVNKTRDEIDKVKNLGRKSVREIHDKLSERGLSLRE